MGKESIGYLQESANVFLKTKSIFQKTGTFASKINYTAHKKICKFILKFCFLFEV